MAKVKKVKKIAENLLVEHSLDFIVESHETVTMYESEGDDGKKGEGAEFLKLTGIFQKGNYPNSNKRIYKTELLVRETKRFQSRITQRLAMGKVYHPGFFDQGGPAGVTDVSHRITKLWMDGDIVRGELLVFKTASGKDVEAITDGGGRIGISSRGWGSMKRYDSVKTAGVEYKDVWVVDDNYHLETFDLVLIPSVKTAIMRPAKSESQDGDIDGVNDCNENDSEGGNSSMTIEELKSLHPELYNKIHDAAVKEGKDIGISEARTQVANEHRTATEAKDKEIGEFKIANETLITENADLKKKNEELEADKAKVEAEKLASDIKVVVSDAVSKSDYKDYFKAEDIDFIASKCGTVEDVANEVKAREGVYESAITTFKATNIVVDTKSKNTMDTSENNSDGKNDNKEKIKSVVRNDMRFMAGL